MKYPERKQTRSGGLIYDKDTMKVLLVHQKESGLWGIPKGCIEKGEKPYEGAIREIREETSLDLKKDNLRIKDRQKIYGNFFFVFCVPCKKTIICDTREISEARWVSIYKVKDYKINGYSRTVFKKFNCMSCYKQDLENFVENILESDI
jgi:8-oxo-dGTP pyrophosphatase MutT (NUDIX family)